MAKGKSPAPKKTSKPSSKKVVSKPGAKKAAAKKAPAPKSAKKPEAARSAGAGSSAIKTPKQKTESYKPGPGRPPKGKRFLPGQSGNPKGRPKGLRSLTEIVEKVAGQRVSITLDGKKQNISSLYAAGIQLAAQAVHGDLKAIKEFLTWVDKMEVRAAAKKPVEFPFSDADVEVLHTVYQRIQDIDARNENSQNPEGSDPE